MDTSCEVRRLVADDTDAYVALRHEMLAGSPAAFLASADSDRGTDAPYMRERLEAGEAWHAMFGAFAGDQLVGAAGVVRPGNHAKGAHKAHLWGMWVSPSHRGRGLGRRLVDAAIAHAATIEGVRFLALGVTDAAPGARRLYERAGFVAWGKEPAALHLDGVDYDEVHMQRVVS